MTIETQAEVVVGLLHGSQRCRSPCEDCDVVPAGQNADMNISRRLISPCEMMKYSLHPACAKCGVGMCARVCM